MSIFEKLPPVPLAQSEQEYDCANGAFMRVFGDASAADFGAYRDLLINAGFSLYTETELEDNYSADLTGSGITVHLFFSGYDGILRVIADPYTALPAKEPLHINGAVTPSFYLFETDHSLIDCGMCLILQFADGSFFVVDSAHSFSVNDNDRIHAFLRERTPANQKIRIAGWFFTHGHSDHVCKFCDFLEYNCADVEIEGFYYNFVPVTHRDADNWNTSEKNRITRFVSLVDERSDIPKYKLHSLQQFYIRDFKFTVLTTHEDVYPNSVADFNDSSTALMVEYGGTKICIPGDASRNASDVMTARYPKYLKCDIMQLSHHGHTGCRQAFYELAAAPLLLIPNTHIKFDEEYPRLIEDRIAVGLSKEHYISSDGTVKVPLPYGSGKVTVLPDETTEDFNGIYDLWQYTYTDEFKRDIYNGYLSRGGKEK